MVHGCQIITVNFAIFTAEPPKNRNVVPKRKEQGKVAGQKIGDEKSKQTKEKKERTKPDFSNMTKEEIKAFRQQKRLARQQRKLQKEQSTPQTTSMAIVYLTLNF